MSRPRKPRRRERKRVGERHVRVCGRATWAWAVAQGPVLRGTPAGLTLRPRPSPLCKFPNSSLWTRASRSVRTGPCCRSPQHAGETSCAGEETPPKSQALGRRRVSSRPHGGAPGDSGCWRGHGLRRRRENLSGPSCTGNRCSGPAVTDATVPTTHRPALVTNPTGPKGAGGAVLPGKRREAGAGNMGDHAEQPRCLLLQTQTPRPRPCPSAELFARAAAPASPQPGLVAIPASASAGLNAAFI